MVLRMKSTFEIDDDLFERLKAVAREDGVSMRDVLNAALRHELAVRARREQFVLDDRSVAGLGLSPEFQDASWDRMRAAIYDDQDRDRPATSG